MAAMPDQRPLRAAPLDNDLQHIRRVFGAMLVRAGLVDTGAIERADRVISKLGGDRTLLSVLASTEGIERERVVDCIRQQRPDLPLGALLVELGFIHGGQLRQALQLQATAKTDQKIGGILVSRKMLRERDLTLVLAAQLGFPSEEPDICECDRDLIQPISLKTIERFDFLPLRRVGDEVEVAFVDPMDQNARTEASRSVGTGIRPVMCSASSLYQLISAIRRQRERMQSPKQESDASSAAPDLVDRILIDAITAGASDIHIEPLQDRVRVRARIDGILRELQELPSEELPSVVSRLKIMAEADIAERRRHQDGRLEFEHPDTGMITDMRASFYVTVLGECVVLRVLNQASRIIELDQVGFAPSVLDRFKRSALELPSGVVIVTGPTGSGKTSTLYSCVNHLSDDTTSIISAEDPVEYRIDGVTQCSVAPKVGRTFEESLRHVVRQDPDVIVLGEIRDAATAESAIQAALTGHKVLTTFHTEDSIGGLLRLMNMNIESFLISSTVVCVIAQRLLRRVCSDCSRDVSPDVSDLQAIGWQTSDASGAEFKEGAGCQSCHFTGYRGRIAVFEALVLSEAVREAIVERKTSAQIRRISLESSGLVTLLEDGLMKAATGETTLREIRRTLPRLATPRSLSEIRRLSGLR
jgi:type IV pilus assembly protein PilB